VQINDLPTGFLYFFHNIALNLNEYGLTRCELSLAYPGTKNLLERLIKYFR